MSQIYNSITTRPKKKKKGSCQHTPKAIRFDLFQFFNIIFSNSKYIYLIAAIANYYSTVEDKIENA